MKKNDIFLILGLVVVVILGFFVMKGDKYEPSYELPLTLSGDAGLHELSYDEYQEKIDNNEHFVVILERATCSHCVEFMPVAEDFAEDSELPLYYVDTDTFDERNWEDFEKSITFFKEKGDNWGTPTIVVQAGKDTVSYIEGVTTADKLQALYDEYFDLGE